MTFNVKLTIDLEVEVDGEIPKALNVADAIEYGISEAIPSVIYAEENVVNLFARSWTVKAGRMRWNRGDIESAQLDALRAELVRDEEPEV